MSKVLSKPVLYFKKEGMSRVVLDGGDSFPVTILSYIDAGVVSTVKKDDYMLLTIGYNPVDEKKSPKSLNGVFKKNSSAYYSFIKTSKIKEDLAIDLPSLFNLYSLGDYVDVCSKTLGKGFAGVMKRHNFSGLRASHGVSISHRSHGSTGQCQDPGRVFKGKKMAGHMGHKSRTAQNLKIVEINEEYKFIAVSGSVPGYKGATVKISPAIKLN